MIDKSETTEPLLWNARQAAKALGISERTLWTLTFGDEKRDIAAELPHVRIGHRVLYEPEDVRAWIKRKKVGGETEAPC